MTRRLLPLLIVLPLTVLCAFPPAEKNIRYVALGDSYTICTGAKQEESWPVLLASDLKKKGIDVTLVANPARNGYTTTDLIEQELPVLETSKPHFVTLCIGVNDWVQGVDSARFKKNFVLILDRVQKTLPDKQKLIVLTIPDFSVTPSGKLYGNGRNISKGLEEFNAIITREAAKRKLKVVDLYPVSKGMANDRTLVADDELHPSAKEYALWEKIILPAAEEMLKK